jgi:hypothetical protein
MMAYVSNLVALIRTRRQQLDQVFNDDLRRMRQRFGDQAVKRALAEMYRLQAEREAIPSKPQDKRGPQHFRK